MKAPLSTGFGIFDERDLPCKKRLMTRAAWGRFRALSGDAINCEIGRATRPCGEVPEWSNGAVSKTVVLFGVPWFESHPLRHQIEYRKYYKDLATFNFRVFQNGYWGGYWEMRKLRWTGRPNLYSRGRIYYFRFQFHGHLIQHLGIREYKKSLGIIPLDVARFRCRVLTARMLLLIAKLGICPNHHQMTFCASLANICRRN